MKKKKETRPSKKTSLRKKITWGVVFVLLAGALAIYFFGGEDGRPIGQYRRYTDAIDNESSGTHEPKDFMTDIKKPIIYLYPTKTMPVKVELGRASRLTHTYPKYADGWEVLAHPDGRLTDPRTQRQYYALYWEGKRRSYAEPLTEGFIVKGEDTANFLEVHLAKLGLTPRESEEFIIYWLPKLGGHPYNYIRFQTKREQDRNMSLMIRPEPTTVIRVMMEYAPLQKPVNVPQQVLPPTPVRHGFTVVEWGGTEVPVKP